MKAVIYSIRYFSILFFLLGIPFSVSAQFGSLLVVEFQENGFDIPINVFDINRPAFSDYEYCLTLEFDVISTSGPDVIDPATLDIDVLPNDNAIALTSGPQIVNGNQIEFCFMPSESTFQLIVDADDDSPFTFGSAAIFSTQEISVCIVPESCNDGQCANDAAFNFNRSTCSCEFDEEICNIPTLGQWGLMSCFLLILIVGVNEQKEKTKVQNEFDSNNCIS